MPPGLPRPALQVLIVELGSQHDAIIAVAKKGVLLALEHNMLPKPILQEALRWASVLRSHLQHSALLWSKKHCIRPAFSRQLPWSIAFKGNNGRVKHLALAPTPCLQAHPHRPGVLQLHQPASAATPAPPAGA